jgi:hypothetical protein
MKIPLQAAATTNQKLKTGKEKNEKKCHKG